MNSPAIVEALGSKASSVAGDSLRLNLGGRDTVIPGFKTVDFKAGPTVDYVMDITDLSRFKDGSVSEIYASHCLEHSSHLKTPAILKEWRRVLSKGGKCYISVPDFDAAIRLYHDYGMLTDFLIHLLWGDQGYDMAYHYTGFTYPILSLLLSNAGFDDCRKIKWMPYEINDCSRLVDTVFHMPISLTVEATA
jgi:SAM-dependent methyltransferase